MSEQTKPEVGMGVSFSCWTDRYPGHISYVSPSGKLIRVRTAKHAPGPGHHYYNNPVWIITPDPEGAERVFTLRKNGRWVEKGSGMKGGYRCGLGVASYHHDPSF